MKILASGGAGFIVSNVLRQAGGSEVGDIMRPHTDCLDQVYVLKEEFLSDRPSYRALDHNIFRSDLLAPADAKTQRGALLAISVSDAEGYASRDTGKFVRTLQSQHGIEPAVQKKTD